MKDSAHCLSLIENRNLAGGEVGIGAVFGGDAEVPRSLRQTCFRGGEGVSDSFCRLRGLPPLFLGGGIAERNPVIDWFTNVFMFDMSVTVTETIFNRHSQGNT